MKDPKLQEATASEPLTLEEEYQMQRSWAEDEDKCTFILLDRRTEGLEGMCGDVNLYLNDVDDRAMAEIEIMVAEPGSRRRGIAREALLIMMLYGMEELGIRRFVAKIGDSNEPSQKLFQQLHFKEVGRSTVFKEVTFEVHVKDLQKELFDLKGGLKYSKYHTN
ncbi:N-acetyltransferase 9-like protein [Coccomyxa sp. Obi]|nr:N-acetyltransferase 9-like protein [Coccomyxa sp. Obi]